MNDIDTFSLVQHGNENRATLLQIRHNTDTTPCEECINTVGPGGKYKNYWCKADQACYPHGAIPNGSTTLGCPKDGHCVAKGKANCKYAVCDDSSSGSYLNYDDPYYDGHTDCSIIAGTGTTDPRVNGGCSPKAPAPSSWGQNPSSGSIYFQKASPL
jgi:hypothetical protein